MSNDIEYQDLPEDWSWWSGNVGPGYYTRWFGTDRRGDGYDGEVYNDGTEKTHYVAIYPHKGMRDDGDPEIAEFPCARGEFDTEQEAVNAVPELVREADARDLKN